MKNEFKYPTDYEFEEVLSNITDNNFLRKFAQSKGIFITNCKQDDLASELINLFYEDIDFEAVRKEAYQITSNHALSGFTISSKKRSLNLNQVYEMIFQNGKRKKGIELSSLKKIEDPFTAICYQGSLQYERKKPGRIEFLQDEVGSFDFYLKKQDDQTWHIEVDCNKSTDLKELQTLFENNINKDDNLYVETINHDALNTINAILFLDRLAKEGLGKEWTCTDIRHLTFKKGKEKKEDNTNGEILIESDEEDEVEEVEEQEMLDITQAVLQGKNLRENKFVKESEANGYRFTAMTYEFENKITPSTIRIKAEFKGRPKVFEVSISTYEESMGLKAVKKTATLNISEHRNIRSIFWNNAKKIFDDLANISYTHKKI